jgi:hypothetical protein
VDAILAVLLRQQQVPMPAVVEALIEAGTILEPSREVMIQEIRLADYDALLHTDHQASASTLAMSKAAEVL